MKTKQMGPSEEEKDSFIRFFNFFTENGYTAVLYPRSYDMGAEIAVAILAETRKKELTKFCREIKTRGRSSGYNLISKKEIRYFKKLDDYLYQEHGIIRWNMEDEKIKSLRVDFDRKWLKNRKNTIPKEYAN